MFVPSRRLLVRWNFDKELPEIDNHGFYGYKPSLLGNSYLRFCCFCFTLFIGLSCLLVDFAGNTN